MMLLKAFTPEKISVGRRLRPKNRRQVASHKSP
jgi:hypothetical protein